MPRPGEGAIADIGCSYVSGGYIYPFFPALKKSGFLFKITRLGHC